MLKRLLTQKRYFKNIYKEQKGITGLETAIILIAFVVVAAVFAYTVLSAGLFSTQKSQQAVYSGLQETQSTLQIKGSVIAQGVAQLNSCDNSASDSSTAAAWVADGEMTPAQSGGTFDTDMVEGAASLYVTSTAAAAIGDHEALIWHAMTAKALATDDVISFWAKVDANAELNGKLYFAISNSNESASTIFYTNRTEVINIDQTDGAWHKYEMTLTGASADDAADWYGIYTEGAITCTAARHFWIDDIIINNANLSNIQDSMTAFTNSVSFAVSLANGNEGIDFSSTTDSDKDGELGDIASTSRSHKVVISYSDGMQAISDLAWTKTALGRQVTANDLLESGETFLITVDLTAVNQVASSYLNKVDSFHKFNLELKPPAGATLIIERTLPERIHRIDDLH